MTRKDAPAPACEIDLAVEDARWAEAVPDLDALAETAVAAALATQGGALTVVLADDATVRDLNRTWRGKDAPTNVLSFPAAGPQPGGGPRQRGDVILAYETVLRESAEQGKPLRHHLAHLLVHGTLHLLGHDHETGDDDATAMEALETAILRDLGIPDPYAETEPCADAAP